MGEQHLSGRRTAANRQPVTGLDRNPRHLATGGAAHRRRIDEPDLTVFPLERDDAVVGGIEGFGQDEVGAPGRWADRKRQSQLGAPCVRSLGK